MRDSVIVAPAGYETKKRIAAGIDRPIGQLTVDIICHNSGVSRPTFYRHFDSKFDIGPWYARFIGEHFLDQIGRIYSWEEGLERHLFLMREQRQLLVFSSYSSPEDNENSQKAMRAHRRNVLVQTLSERGIVPDDDMLFCIDAYVLIETHMVGEWIHLDMPKEPDELARQVALCVPRPLYEAFEII